MLILVFPSLRSNGLLPRLYTVVSAPASDGRVRVLGELCPILGVMRERALSGDKWAGECHTRTASALPQHAFTAGPGSLRNA
jgi:hypothetical protein